MVGVIRKVRGRREYELVSHYGRNLGVFSSRSAAEKHEREVAYFGAVRKAGLGTYRPVRGFRREV